MNIHSTLSAVAVLALATPGFGQAPTPAAREAVTNYLLTPADKILGLNVKDEGNKSVGEIGDVLIDPRTGALRYAVVEAGGFLGMGESQRIVPWVYVRVSADEKDPTKFHAHTNLTVAQVKAAPTCQADTALDAEIDKRVEAAFGKNELWAPEVSEKITFVRLSELDGVRLDDSAGKKVGSVQDLVLAPQHGCVVFAVIDTTKEAGGKDVALPFSKLSYAYDAQRKLTATTPVDMSRFAGAPGYDTKEWKRSSGTPWLNDLAAYYSVDPFWKSTRFASARDLPRNGP